MQAGLHARATQRWTLLGPPAAVFPWIRLHLLLAVSLYPVLAGRPSSALQSTWKGENTKQELKRTTLLHSNATKHPIHFDKACTYEHGIDVGGARWNAGGHLNGATSQVMLENLGLFFMFLLCAPGAAVSISSYCFIVSVSRLWCACTQYLFL